MNFGEKRMLDHPARRFDPIPRIVSWFQINDVKKRVEAKDHSELELSYKILQSKRKLKSKNACAQ